MFGTLLKVEGGSERPRMVLINLEYNPWHLEVILKYPEFFIMVTLDKKHTNTKYTSI